MAVPENTLPTPPKAYLSVDMDISGNTLVFGGGSGIGRACALALSRRIAASITIADIDAGSANRVADECRGVALASEFQADAFPTDVTSEQSVNEILTRAVRLFGCIDHVVNSVGLRIPIYYPSGSIAFTGPADPLAGKLGILMTREIAEADTVEFKRLVDVNVTVNFLVTKCVSAIIKTQEPQPNDPSSPNRGSTRGTIVTLGSASSFASSPSMVQYTTFNFAVLGLTKNSALDNAAYDIRVNCVCPSWVQTPTVKQAIDTVPGLGNHIDSAVPMGRIAQPEEVADAVNVAGCGFIIDGGTTLTSHV